MRRGRRSEGKTADISIFDQNLNGYNGKRASIGELLNIIQPTVATFQETAIVGNNRIKVKNYFSFQRNRKGVKTMGGVATLVSNNVKQYAVKVREGEDTDEYLVTRLNHVVPAVNIINVYGGIEGRMSKQEVMESWTRLNKEITDIKERQEGLVLIGDMNRAIGSDNLGVEGNHSSISYGGGLLRELLQEKEHKQEYYLLNSLEMTEGGPWTWVSRVDAMVKSCLDLVIVSANLKSYVSKMLVDSKQEFCPKKVVMTRGKQRMIRSDHFPLIMVLKNMPKAKMMVKRESWWNLHKPGGWEVYKAAMEEASEKIDNITRDESLEIDEVMTKTDAIMNKVKYKAFGKSKPMTEKAAERRLEVRLKAAQGLDDDDKVKELMKTQYIEMEEMINNLKLGKFGRATNIHKMKQIVTGSKKAAQEPHAVLDSEKEELVVSNEEIKKVTLKHCLDSLKNNDPEEDVKPLVDLVNKVHDRRMEVIDDDDFEVTKDDFDEIVNKIEKKHKRSYDFLTKAGDGFKNSIFKLFRRMIMKEEFPTRFFETILHQLWKLKFPREALSNYRYLHMKLWEPKVLEAMVVSKMKPNILGAGTKYQIGGKPYHRVEEHLIATKALISRSLVTEGGCMAQQVDIQGFFDAESLRGVMGSLFSAKIPLKTYRLWYKLNSKTVIRVSTPSGLTEAGEAGELCAQGSSGAALASQLDVDMGIKTYFQDSKEEASYGSVRIQPQCFQDDIQRIALNVSSARAGNIKLHMMLSERLLRCHPLKTCYILYGSKKYKEQVRKELDSCPLKFGEFEMKEKDQDVYLGDVLSSKGLAASVEATITHRTGKIKGQIYETAAILKDFRIQSLGGMRGAWDIWEMSIIPSLLANCGSWVEMSKTAVEMLDDLQNLFCRLVYACPSSTPIPALRGEAALLDMEHRVMIEKVCLVTGILFHHEEEDNYARDLLQEQLHMGWGGLTREVVEICSKVGLPDACKQYVHRDVVVDHIRVSNLKKLKKDMEGLGKLERIIKEDLRKPQKYMELVSLEDARLEFRWRTNMLDTRASMGKRYSSKECPHCREGREEGVEESGTHWLSCLAYEKLRQGLDPELVLGDRVIYLRRVQQMRKELEKML